ncbi:MAG: helix-turn-helix transcriptional regulator [Chloroflexi bacterium]|nr:helix-turn-helix transcriptional regulator [Chloroflexota bacterium]
MPIVPAEFTEFLIEECKQHHWSWNEASTKAGLSRNAISSYVNSQARPGLKACTAFARLFKKPPEYVLQLAGHLPKPRRDENKPPQVAEIEYRLEQLSHPIREQYLPIISAILDAAETAEGEKKGEEK